jgi:hypothetical protein
VFEFKQHLEDVVEILLLGRARHGDRFALKVEFCWIDGSYQRSKRDLMEGCNHIQVRLLWALACGSDANSQTVRWVPEFCIAVFAENKVNILACSSFLPHFIAHSYYSKLVVIIVVFNLFQIQLHGVLFSGEFLSDGFSLLTALSSHPFL